MNTVMFPRFAFPLVTLTGTVIAVSLDLAGFPKTNCLAAGVAVQLCLTFFLIKDPAR